METPVLVLGSPQPELEACLSQGFKLHRMDPDGVCLDSFAWAKDIRGIVVCSHYPVTRDLMMSLPKLEIVSCCSAGYEHVDVAWAAERGIVVTNTPGVLTEEVADTAIGLLLCTVRRFPQAERFLREGKWLHGNFPLSSRTLREGILGIIGMGRIGQAVARRLMGFDVTVVYHGPTPKPELPYRYYDDLTAMARDVHVLINCAPGGDDTRHMIDSEILKALGPEGTFINVGRGSSVNEESLILALERGELGAAGLDVYLDEPHVPGRLIALDNVVLFPHLGSATEKTRRAMFRLAADNLIAWNEGKEPLTPVSETPRLLIRGTRGDS